MIERKIKVLVVDDEKIIRDFFGKLLTLQGIEVVCAENGYKAIELSRNTKFDLYFIDVRMPGLNGLETYRQIRKINPNAQAVLMTGYAVEEILQQAQKEGVYASIHKPFDISEMRRIVDSIIIEKKKEILNILVVDDDEAVLNFFANLLKNKNQKYKTVQNREEALLAAKKEKFDLVFLDLVLKEISGVDLYQEIKEILSEATVVVITGFPQKADEIKGKVEIAGCLYKPFDIESVLKAIENAKTRKLPPHPEDSAKK